MRRHTPCTEGEYSHKHTLYFLPYGALQHIFLRYRVRGSLAAAGLDYFSAQACQVRQFLVTKEDQKKGSGCDPLFMFGAQGENRTRTVIRPRDFKSLVSTNSTTWAGYSDLLRAHLVFYSQSEVEYNLVASDHMFFAFISSTFRACCSSLYTEAFFLSNHNCLADFLFFPAVLELLCASYSLHLLTMASISRTAWSSPTRTARLIIAWPMLSSSMV